MMANALLHTHSPLLIVEQRAKCASSVIFVEMRYPDLEGQPLCRPVPSAGNRGWNPWWQFSTDFFVQFIGILGFGDLAKTTHVQP